jgi:predicted amidohydrolase
MTRFDYGLSGSLQIQYGILEGINRIIERLSRAVLEELKEDLEKKTIGVDWENVWETGIKSLDLEFLMDLYSIFIQFKDAIEVALQLQQGSSSGSSGSFTTTPPVSVSVSVSDITPSLTTPSSFSPSSKSSFFKVLVMQSTSTTPELAVKELRWILEEDKSGRSSDFVIYHEYWVEGKILGEIGENPFVKAFQKIAKEFDVYIILGSFLAFGPSSSSSSSSKGTIKKIYNTTPVIGRDGSLVGTYQKQRPILGQETVTAGNSVFYWEEKERDLSFAVLICFDVENQDVLQATLKYKPQLIFNPVFIPSVPIPGGTTGSQKTEGSTSEEEEDRRVLLQWRNSVDSMRRKFEAICLSEGFSLIRCDRPSGTGTSQVITPCSTFITSSLKAGYFYSFIDKKRLTSSTPTSTYVTLQPLHLGETGERERTAQEDNNGNRYLVRHLSSISSLPSYRDSPGIRTEIITCARFTKTTMLIGCSDNTLRYWDGIQPDLERLPIVVKLGLNLEEKMKFLRTFVSTFAKKTEYSLSVWLVTSSPSPSSSSSFSASSTFRVRFFRTKSNISWTSLNPLSTSSINFVDLISVGTPLELSGRLVSLLPTSLTSVICCSEKQVQKITWSVSTSSYSLPQPFASTTILCGSLLSSHSMVVGEENSLLIISTTEGEGMKLERRFETKGRPCSIAASSSITHAFFHILVTLVEGSLFYFKLNSHLQLEDNYRITFRDKRVRRNLIWVKAPRVFASSLGTYQTEQEDDGIEISIITKTNENEALASRHHWTKTSIFPVRSLYSVRFGEKELVDKKVEVTEEEVSGWVDRIDSLVILDESGSLQRLEFSQNNFANGLSAMFE